MAKKSGNNLITPIALLAVIVIGGMLLFGGQAPAPGGAPALPSLPGAQPATPAQANLNVGELELFLKSATGITAGADSSLILLDKNAHWKGSEDATRYDLMRIHYDKGLDGMTSMTGGTPKAITASSGEWSEAGLSARIGDEFVVYTYKDTSPASTENKSTAKLLKLVDFYRETGKWVAQTADGKASWNLYNYGDYDFFDGTDSEKNFYTYGDSGSADSNKVISWYTRANAQGEECVDCSVYIDAPSNYTSKFKSLTLTDKFGHSVKYTTMSKAENFAGDDSRGIASTVLSAAQTNNYHYYIGDIPKDFVTLYTSADANRLTWELNTDTYGTNVTVKFNVVQNAKAAISNNGPFTITDDFVVELSTNTTSTFS